MWRDVAWRRGLHRGAGRAIACSGEPFESTPQIAEYFSPLATA
jgi:hypothetical protein